MKNTVWDEIDEMLSSNGDMTQKVTNRLMLRGLSDLRENQDILDAKVCGNTDEIECLKRNNLLMWIKGHPWASVALFLLFSILADINVLQRIRLALEPLFSLP